MLLSTCLPLLSFVGPQDFAAALLLIEEHGAPGDVGRVAFAVDVDGDGDLDLLRIESAPDELRVHASLQAEPAAPGGVGAFAAPIASVIPGLGGVEIGLPDRGLAVELTGDGLIDLALVAQQSGEGVVALLAGAGDGNFGWVASHPAPSLFGDTLIAALEFDGQPGGEVVVARQGESLFGTELEVLGWDGTGLQVLDALPPFLSVFRHELETGDLDGDGDDDVVFEGFEPRVHMTDAGLLGPGVEVPNALEGGARELLLADVDGDGDRDLVQVGVVQLEVQLNDGVGQFTAQPLQPLPDAPFVDLAFGGQVWLDAGDLDGDGREQLVGKLRAADPSSLATGGSALACALAFDEAGALERVEWFPSASGEAPAGLGDLNGDGTLDWIGAREWWSGELSGRAPVSGVVATPGVVAPPGAPDAVRLVFDADLDGDLDLLTAAAAPEGSGQQSVLSLYLNDAAGALASAELFSGPTALAPDERVVALAQGDLDLDGRPELLLALEQASVPPLDLGWRRFELLPGGAQELQSGGASSGPSSSLPLQVLGAFDIDGDGMPDLVAGDGGFLPGDGSGGLGAPVSLPKSGAILDSGDLDGDGDVDLLIGGADLALLLADGAGGFAVQSLSPDGCVLAHLLDLDADGDLDVAAVMVAAAEGPRVELFENAAGSVLPTGQVLTGAPDGMRELALADVDGDGLGDLVLAAAGAADAPGRLAVARGALVRSGSAFGFDPLVRTVVWPVPSLGDFDGDGDLDAHGRWMTPGLVADGDAAGSVRQYGPRAPGAGGLAPLLGCVGPLAPGSASASARLVGALGGTAAWLVSGPTSDGVPDFPLSGLTTLVDPVQTLLALPIDGPPDEPGAGAWHFDFADFTPFAGLTQSYQVFVLDTGAPNGLVSASNGLELRFGF